MKIFTTVNFLAIILLIFSQRASSQEKPVVLRTPTGKIYGTLSFPDKKKDLTVVLIISGSGPTDRNCNQPNMKTNSFKYLADSLRKYNIASVRFDKREVGESVQKNIKESDLRFENYINDVKLWIELLSKDKRFSRIVVAGHSEGSLIGMVACASNPNVKAFISISGPGTSADIKIKEQIADQSPKMKSLIISKIDSLKNGDTLLQIPISLFSLFRPSIQPYMKSWFKYNPQEEISELRIPVLIIQGTTDIQVSENDAELLYKANPLARKEIIQNMNHILKTCSTTDKSENMATYYNTDLPLNTDFVKIFIDFIRAL